ncbi:plasmid stabilization system protein ParE [Thermocatellispora tengchongensis]|uniref:Plasmid stabilization system protein ParE n=1 Tax=Thermocatellispora tengchongensis TaxID=1073253 RepID=A0A840PRW6_9ACTN|nr:hypothetical protein [Thermocatellispora tengchongensis]MBB5139857.1 plasmid stabilization system protein ParE [Thermocatellispora tengchongensis]
MPTSRSKSVPEDLLPEARELADYLSSLFDQLGKSMRVYAQEKSLTPRVISHFLRGQRIPPPEFVSSLLKDAADATRDPLPPEEIERAQQLRLKAVRASTNAQYELEDLRARLEVANALKEQADERLRTLVDVIASLHNEAGIVREEHRELEGPPARKAITARGRLELEQRKQKHAYLVRTEEGIEDEIEQLNIKLKEAREAKERAEKRCQDLEVALKQALQKFAIMGGLIGRPNIDLPESIKDYIDNHRIRWGGIIGWFIGPLTAYILPAYLGIMYQLVFDRSRLLQIATLIGLIIPIWFAYGIKRLERAGVSRVAHLLYTIAGTAIIFGVAAILPRYLWLF